ncbi:MAG: class I SAM-dependent methyltransferase [Pseudomonadota bacterium]
MTPLARTLIQRIAVRGPITIARYMAEALGHPVHGYYQTRDPLGAQGDFTTAPEISQMFGELIGLWCADLWQRAGMPETVMLVELGPGRGTLMADALRALALLPRLYAATSVHFVETSPVLRARQAGLVPDAQWHDRLADVPQGFAFVIANEFFDALPVRQLVRHRGAWRERMVGLDGTGERLAPCIETASADLSALVPPDLRAGPEGAVFETCPAGLALAHDLGARLATQGGAALIIDYGHAASGHGETLQAVKGHGFADPFAAPGEADLTAHVDFAALALAARKGGAMTHGPVAQGAFLAALGIAERAERLTAGATPQQRAAIEAACARLVEGQAMGQLFKVLALTGRDMPWPAGFS